MHRSAVWKIAALPALAATVACSGSDVELALETDDCRRVELDGSPVVVEPTTAEPTSVTAVAPDGDRPAGHSHVHHDPDDLMVGLTEWHTSTPEFGTDRIDQFVRAEDLGTGGTLWRARASLASGDVDRVALAAGDGVFVLDARTGNVRWCLVTPHVTDTALRGGRAFVAAWPNQIAAFDVATGDLSWSVTWDLYAPEPNLLAVSDLLLAFGSPLDGSMPLLVLDATTGAVLGNFAIEVAEDPAWLWDLWVADDTLMIDLHGDVTPDGMSSQTRALDLAAFL
jgi:PQQ-like domain